MIKTLRESKARLSELVESAAKGQEVLITVRGKVRARLVPVKKDRSPEQNSSWVKELRALHKAYGKHAHKTKTDGVLNEIREDRL